MTVSVIVQVFEMVNTDLLRFLLFKNNYRVCGSLGTEYGK